MSGGNLQSYLQDKKTITYGGYSNIQSSVTEKFVLSVSE